MPNPNPSPATRIGAPGGPKPGSLPGKKVSNPWDKLQENILEMAKLPFVVLDDPEDKAEFVEKLRVAAVKNPPGYVAKIIIPLLRLLPQRVVVEIFGSIDTGDRAMVAAALESMRLIAAEDIEAGRGLEDARIEQDRGA